MALSDHLKLSILIDGVFQASIQDVKVNGKSGAQAVNTLQGLAGKTPGSKSLSITGKWAVPLSGLEFNAIQSTAEGTFHEIQIPVGAQTIVSSGWFDEFDLSGATDQSTEFNATFMGELNAPE